MKTLILSMFAMLSTAAHAQGPMPPCVSQAQHAAASTARADYPGRQLDGVGVSVSYQDAHELAWQIEFRDLSTGEIVDYQVIAYTPSCQVGEVREASPANESSNQASGAEDCSHSQDHCMCEHARNHTHGSCI